MAETRCEDGQDGCDDTAITDMQSEDNSAKKSSKRCSSTSPATSASARKSPRTDDLSSTIQTPDAEEQPGTDKQEMEAQSSTSSLPVRRKSCRRATLTRRSLPPLPDPHQALSWNISADLSQKERLEQLLEASVKMALERTQESLQSVPNGSLDSFKKQVEHIQKECGSIARSFLSEFHQLPPSALSSSDPVVQQILEKIQRAFDCLKTESESWEALLNKHRSKEEELERKVAQGQETGIAPDSTLLAQSSQYDFIQSKPDYHLLLRQQQPVLHTMEVIMDKQCKVVRKLLSIKELYQAIVKKISSQLAAEAGFQDVASDLFRNLVAPPSMEN